MREFLLWLQSHDKLAGWAQFAGAVLALLVTYFTAFMPIWHRKRQLRKAAARLLSHGYEVLESYHRTTPNFLPTSLTLRAAALSFGGIIDEIGRFPVYELDDQGSRSLARYLVAMNGTLVAARFVIENTANDLGNREATEDERDVLVAFLTDRLEFARQMLAGEELKRPEWPTPDGP
ncbi:hypothetical protein KV697_09545 [Sphingomonas sanguinis]|uniref:DUF4760 domain-containing protein n=1 Tax=Sphingomonas sanguinis TaxID=33051 RepID=A0ABU5LTL9_9SPHN|nr:hypothetical protein [Sphingomonas sanguinis]MDZ7283045.1 hypothetical protein [Sphingomonas sanguinis]QXT37483.1 hypothetical protein KV697_09545 [Sphingomonas sanguinis]